MNTRNERQDITNCVALNPTISSIHNVLVKYKCIGGLLCNAILALPCSSAECNTSISTEMSTKGVILSYKSA